MDITPSGICGPPASLINNPLMPWSEAILQPGAAQMQHCEHLSSCPFLARVPDDSIYRHRPCHHLGPGGAGPIALVATRDQDGSYAMVYVPVGRKFKVRMDKITGPKLSLVV